MSETPEQRYAAVSALLKSKDDSAGQRLVEDLARMCIRYHRAIEPRVRLDPTSAMRRSFDMDDASQSTGPPRESLPSDHEVAGAALEFDTVRGVFEEGLPAFPGAAIRQKSHVQVAVRNPACVLGLFRPTGYTL